MMKTQLAAGTVCWRNVYLEGGARELMVLLIHRTKQKDVSFPKGKLDAGESMPQAAVRETKEETGLDVCLGVNLGTINYELPGGKIKKTVQYWAAEVTSEAVFNSSFTPGGEVQALEWVKAGEARQRLSYRADKELFDVFLKLAELGLHDTFSLVLLRHAKAVSRGGEHQVDALRPLALTGFRQADTLVPILQTFGPGRIYSSPAVRCVETVTPLSEFLHKKIREKKSLSQDSWDAGDLGALRRFTGKLVARGKNALLCSHRPVLPDLARELVLATGSLPGEYLDSAALLPPGGFCVFHFSRLRPGAGILGVESYPLKHSQ